MINVRVGGSGNDKVEVLNSTSREFKRSHKQTKFKYKNYQNQNVKSTEFEEKKFKYCKLAHFGIDVYFLGTKKVKTNSKYKTSQVIFFKNICRKQFEVSKRSCEWPSSSTLGFRRVAPKDRRPTLLSLTRLMMIMVVMRMVGVIIMEAMRMVILMTIAPPHQTRDDHGDDDEGCLGQDNNECFALKFLMTEKKIMITKKKKVQLCDNCW